MGETTDYNNKPIIEKLPPSESRKRNSPDIVIHKPDFSNNSRSPSPDDDRQLKRQKRLIKNRESAQLSRQRKKSIYRRSRKKSSHINRRKRNFNKKERIFN